MRLLFEAAGAVWNDEKRLWLLSGLELTDEEMATVYTFGNLASGNGSDFSNRLVGYTGRTTIPFRQQVGLLFGNKANMSGAFALCSNLEILNIAKTTVYPNKLDHAFRKSPKLRKITTVINMKDCVSAGSLATETSSLEFVAMKELKISLSFSDSPNFLVEDDGQSSLAIMVDNAANTDPITVTLHPDAYSRVPDSLKLKAQEKRISIVSV